MKSLTLDTNGYPKTSLRDCSSSSSLGICFGEGIIPVNLLHAPIIHGRYLTRKVMQYVFIDITWHPMKCTFLCVDQSLRHFLQKFLMQAVSRQDAEIGRDIFY